MSFMVSFLSDECLRNARIIANFMKGEDSSSCSESKESHYVRLRRIDSSNSSCSLLGESSQAASHHRFRFLKLKISPYVIFEDQIVKNVMNQLPIAKRIQFQDLNTLVNLPKEVKRIIVAFYYSANEDEEKLEILVRKLRYKTEAEISVIIFLSSKFEGNITYDKMLINELLVFKVQESIKFGGKYPKVVWKLQNPEEDQELMVNFLYDCNSSAN